MVANSVLTQSATVGTAVSAPPSVRVTDINGNPVQGVAVAFVVNSGGGASSPASPAAINTDGNGVATLTSWTLGTIAGSNTVVASASVSTGSPVTFTATGTAAAGNTIQANSTTSQSGTAGSAVGAPPSVRVTDQYGNVKSGVSVTFSVTAGGGSISPASPAVLMTDVNGLATLTSWTLGATVGANTVTASASVPNGSPVAFNATGTVGPANTIAANSSVSQSATVGTAVGAPPSVKITDANNNRVSGVSVTFAVTLGGGVIAPTSAVMTEVNGVATLTSWTLGTTAGSNTVTASASVPNGSPVSFGATGTAAAANTIASNSSVSQSATVGSAVSAPPSVKVTDQYGNAKSGVSVTFTLTGGGGSISPASPAILSTDAAGVATLTSWTLGTTAGTNTVTASASVPNGSPVSFSATGTAAAANTIANNSTTSQSATAGTTVGTPPSVKVTDQYGNAKSGVSVTFAVTAGWRIDQPAPRRLLTDAAGVATLTSWTLGTSVGAEHGDRISFGPERQPGDLQCDRHRRGAEPDRVEQQHESNGHRGHCRDRTVGKGDRHGW